jgi:hypothetical protein
MGVALRLKMKREGRGNVEEKKINSSTMVRH